MSRRNVPRINYQVLNTRGDIVQLEENLSTQLSNLSINDSSLNISLNMANESPSEDSIDLMVMSQEVMDIIEESPINDMGTEEINIIITKLEQLRTSIRKKEIKVTASKEILAEDLRISVNQAVLSIKDFIKAANDIKVKSNLRSERIKCDEAAQKERTVVFLLECLKQSILEFGSIFERDIKKADSNILLNWRQDLSTINNSYEKIRDDYKQCLETPTTNADVLKIIQKTGEEYKLLDKMRQSYITKLTSEINLRELDKHTEFKRSKLNIKLERFSGYDNSTDFYTFRTNFEKMYKSSTPTELLPDLLRNNYLADPALTMVKTLNTIDEIWVRLKEAFGDTRIMLSRKLQQIKSFDFNKRDPEKLIAAFSKIISVMKEASELAEKHKIEEYLYYGDSMAKINQLIGDRRSIRFISSTCEENLSPKQTWNKNQEYALS